MEGVQGPYLILVAHPDDETLGLGSLLLSSPDQVLLAYATDGAPHAARHWQPLGFASRANYAAARARELEDALSIAGVRPAQVMRLGLADQEAALHLTRLTGWLRDLCQSRHPSVLYTHPYEGGHPDHDACAFAARMAVRRLAREGLPAPALWEFTSYHASPEGFASGGFLAPSTGETATPLTLDEQLRKRRMLDCFPTQQRVIQRFDVSLERTRPAPAYDFAAPPHSGPLYYEQRQLGLTGEQFRALAVESRRELEPPWLRD